jgi:putative sterol carrier protein
MNRASGNISDTIFICFYYFVLGKLTDFVVGSGGTSEKEATFVITGSYGTFKGILKGEMNMTIALLKNRLRLKGSKIQALKLMKPLDGVIESLRKITDEFEE